MMKIHEDISVCEPNAYYHIKYSHIEWTTNPPPMYRLVFRDKFDNLIYMHNINPIDFQSLLDALIMRDKDNSFDCFVVFFESVTPHDDSILMFEKRDHRPLYRGIVTVPQKIFNTTKKCSYILQRD